ncbi:MAG: 50S ribosomal protein L14 [Candidatus Aenigmarchaeota archaeon]|nr:50S ribosomal protein L14 [Candidatus Aenigmarchaeota archaeon]MDI6722034.1 50S ribosomal protein L14 [Candidatus Aenigmarchaeota archaeon]
MKAITASITKSIPLKARLVCADNSGAKELELIAVRGYKGRLRRLPKAGIGDVIICSVKKGKEKIRKTVVYAVIVRQKKEYRRIDGNHVRFEDNAAVLVNPKTLEPIGTEIRTVIAKEVVERFSPIGKIASIVL